MKKIFITCILLGAFVPLFQNCGQQGALHGNGDPYEIDPRLDLGDGYAPEIPEGAIGQIGGNSVLRDCSSAVATNKISRVYFKQIDPTNQLVGIITRDNKERSVVSAISTVSVSMNVQFDSGIHVKHMSVSPSSIALSVEHGGVTRSENLSCTTP